jgi:hypothetical protein
VCEFAIFYFTVFAHVSQYLSIRVTPPPTLNRASWVAMLAQFAQNFVLPLWVVKDLSDVKIFSIFILFSPREIFDEYLHQQQYHRYDCYNKYELCVY